MEETKESEFDINSQNYDFLSLKSNKQCAKMLLEYGDNFPENELILYSEKLLKINRKGKKQERILLITNKGLYNILSLNSINKVKRRIKIKDIGSITMSMISNEIVIHIPNEYDYRYITSNKDILYNVLNLCYKNITGNNDGLGLAKILQSSLLSITNEKTKNNINNNRLINSLYYQRIQQRLQRYKELMNYKHTNSDDEDINEIKNTKLKPINNINKSNVNSSDFEYLKVIGRGSFGKVMQVKYRKTNEILAMKILKKSQIIKRNQIEHTKSERIILEQLNHPFLMTLRYAFQTETKLYFVLKYYRGGELFFHLKRKKRFTEIEARIIVAEVSLAIGYLHGLNIIYRDLKPENILLDDDGHICLTDFGLSKNVNTNNEFATTFCGTPEYLAPEIVMNMGHNKCVDWWSIGILLYELTVGIPPYYSQNLKDMYNKIQFAPLLFPPHLSIQCKSLIMLLLERDFKKRLGSTKEDVKEIMRQSFFRNIDWDKLYNKKIKPHYKPNVKSNDDTSNFDKQFTNEPVVDSFVNGKSVSNDDAMFSNFGYIGDDLYQ